MVQIHIQPKILVGILIKNNFIKIEHNLCLVIGILFLKITCEYKKLLFAVNLLWKEIFKLVKLIY